MNNFRLSVGKLFVSKCVRRLARSVVIVMVEEGREWGESCSFYLPIGVAGTVCALALRICAGHCCVGGRKGSALLHG